MMAPASYGRCAAFLVAALAMDVAGLALVLAGAVGRPKLDGQSFEDFLVLTGSLLLFLSLLCWLFWYSGNLRGLPSEEVPLGTRPTPSQTRSRASLLLLAAKLSERLSQRRRSATAPAPSLPPGLGPPAKASRTTDAGRPEGPVELGSLPRAGHHHPQERRAADERLV